ncbi:MAG: hypothetical protein U0325_21110 [Polyangiales bacterium]
MPLLVETNPPAHESALRAVEETLGGAMPASLRALLLRHDGVQTYAEDGQLGWVLHGTDARHIVCDGALARSPDAAEYLGYIRDEYGPRAPLVAETASFTDWLGDGAATADASLRGFVCVAAHWVHHGSVWAPLRADATELLFLPSPGSDDDPVEVLDAALRGPRVNIDGFVAALLAGDEVM